MTRKQCLAILKLGEDASLDDIKRSYRRLAFALHPDLNPDNPNAAKEFQRLNEAYVQLCTDHDKAESATAEKEATQKARTQAKKAYDKAKSRFEKPQSASPRPNTQRQEATHTTREKERDEVLRDLLRDPFARRVFEDIYSQIRQDASQTRRVGKVMTTRTEKVAGSVAGTLSGMADNVTGSVRDWLQRQIDDEQTVHLPHAQLVPGARLRLHIRHGLKNKAQAIEIILPPEFRPGRAIRLKGLGKRIGAWKGDLYLKIIAT